MVCFFIMERVFVDVHVDSVRSGGFGSSAQLHMFLLLGVNCDGKSVPSRAI